MMATGWHYKATLAFHLARRLQLLNVPTAWSHTMKAFCLLMLSLLPFSSLAQPADETALEMVARLGGTAISNQFLPGNPVIRIDLHGTAVTDADLALLAPLTELQVLDLRLTQVTDAGIAHLAGLQELQFLNLFRTSMTDTGLAHLGTLKKLETLLIGGTAISDAGTSTLLDMSALRKVSLFDTRITDAGVLSLGAMERLGVLLLGRTAVSPEAMVSLQEARPELVFTEET